MTDFHDQLFTSTVNGDLEGLSRILAQGADPRHNNSLPICLAAENGHADSRHELLGIELRKVFMATKMAAQSPEPPREPAASLAWPAPFFCRDGIACSLSPPYNDAMNAPPTTP